MSESHICVGVISGSYGVHGELRIKSFCAIPEDIEKYSPLTDEAGEREYMLAILRPITNGFSARLPEISNKEDADT
ncbi:MAG: ribosome maturation factor RimM, partial [Planktotalea sp.]